MSPLCKLGIKCDHTKGVFFAFLLGFGLKIGGNLSEDPFFFALHVILGLNFLFLSQIFVLKFSEIPAPPFKILQTLLVRPEV